MAEPPPETEARGSGERWTAAHERGDREQVIDLQSMQEAEHEGGGQRGEIRQEPEPGGLRDVI